MADHSRACGHCHNRKTERRPLSLHASTIALRPEVEKESKGGNKAGFLPRVGGSALGALLVLIRRKGVVERANGPDNQRNVQDAAWKCRTTVERWRNVRR